MNSKANSTLGFLCRNLRCPAKLKESAYISLVRSTLEYAASVWDPHLAKDINKLENTQRRSARFVKGDYRTTSSVTQILQELGSHDLQSRRRDLILALRHYPTSAPPGGLTLYIEKLLNSSFSINLLCLKDLAHFSYIYPTKEPSLGHM